MWLSTTNKNTFSGVFLWTVYHFNKEIPRFALDDIHFQCFRGRNGDSQTESFLILRNACANRRFFPPPLRISCHPERSKGSLVLILKALKTPSLIRIQRGIPDLKGYEPLTTTNPHYDKMHSMNDLFLLH
jgi:hypothetical protein